MFQPGINESIDCSTSYTPLVLGAQGGDPIGCDRAVDVDLRVFNDEVAYNENFLNSIHKLANNTRQYCSIHHDCLKL